MEPASGPYDQINIVYDDDSDADVTSGDFETEDEDPEPAEDRESCSCSDGASIRSKQIPACLLPQIYWKQRISQDQRDVVRSSGTQYTLGLSCGMCEQLCKDDATAACLHNMQDGLGSAHLKSRWCYSVCMQHQRRDRAMGFSGRCHGGQGPCSIGRDGLPSTW